MTKVYIDGSVGTTGLRIFERLSSRDDLEILSISDDLRKNLDERIRLIDSADISFLCLPDDAAREAAALADKDAKIIDASTAHRTVSGWSYGFPELSKQHRRNIAASKRVAVPGCHAGGVIALVYPLIKAGIMSSDYPLSCFSLTGYSGGGKQMIAEYNDKNRSIAFDSPRIYGLTQNHKHLPEIVAVCALDEEPVFIPVVADYYSGMSLNIPIKTNLLKEDLGFDGMYKIFANYYGGQPLISVKNINESGFNGFIAANSLSGRDDMQIIISGNDERIVLTALFDNLGKGASGAAVQCMNIMIGCEENKGLNF